MDNLSKTVTIKPTREIEDLVAAFNPVVKSMSLKLQRSGEVGQWLKIGLLTNNEWSGTDFKFIVWRYDKFIQQVSGNLAVVIDWDEVSAIHLSVSEIVPKVQITHLGTADLI